MSTKGIAISLFSGAGGLDLGAEQAGYEVRAAVEWDRDAAATMEKNFDHLASPVIQGDILTTPTSKILAAAGLRRGQRPDLLIGADVGGLLAIGWIRGELSEPPVIRPSQAAIRFTPFALTQRSTSRPGHAVSSRRESSLSKLCSTYGMSGGAHPDWWSYPGRCPAGHEWGPGRVIVSWSPCDCPGALTHPGNGHQCVRCGTPGCTATWYRPKHGWPPAVQDE